MDFGCRDGFYQDEQMISNDASAHNFPFSSPSFVSSSSSPHYRAFFPVSNKQKHNQEQEQQQLAPNNSASTSTSAIEKEHMFDKVVTPSDVGKLNRLVIPKQHAEKYFPLDSSTNEKGLLLNFEDRTGKPWRFRYSYWNSSQSYVMTKGWSRFVKEKKLDAGDIVSFQRGLADQAKDRLFIDWRRRHSHNGLQFDHQTSSGFGLHRSSVPWSPMFLRPPPGAVVQFSHQPNNFSTFHQNTNQNRYNHYYYNNNVNPCPGSIIYLRSATAQIQEGGGVAEPMIFDSVPVVHGKTVSKKLRLFGVNMECGVSSEHNSPDDDHHHQSNNATAMMVESHESNIPFTTLQSTRLYDGIPVQTDLFLNKGKSSSMSLDLDI